ncbi:putative Diguanylate cyclase [Candidatus Nitrotoga sp. HW29]|uniref:putative bifunctional diguanylate cyclase/phosphodiesterase n=1 Tax=Candidatus Nitrotoga sp. HW29 TaxID=2886963 RepID=UPI001EF2A014|nr:bifunctional diguanylate cyclase/phosphodiesterase [Candidatus Nitrotoga sp. HW29]CAH1905448.1 putative Diguanylate cyclase [Candidatus Nitrotoga sp. HW29]
MSKKPNGPDPLRTKAETQLDRAPEADETPRPAKKLLHELQVCQVDLKMQNKALLQAQIELEESRDHYMDLYDFAPVGYLTLTREALISDVNLTGATLLGMERSQLMHHRFAHWVAAEDNERWNRFFVSMLQNDERQSCELVLKRGHSSIFHAQLDCLHIKAGNDGNSVRISFTDISERKQALEALRIAAIAFESHEGILVTDACGVISCVNHAFTRLTGYSTEEAVGRTPAILSSGQHGRDFYQRMRTTLNKQKYWQGEMWNKRKNGKIYADWLTISAITGDDGNITHYVGIFSDITSNPESSAEIHRLAYYDSLTHLPNRRMLFDRLRQALAASSRSKHYGALLFLDLDNFKTLNDTYGHSIGDLLLIEIAQRLTANIREGDTEARLGGDEFVLMLENLSENTQEAVIQAGLIGEKIRHAVALPYIVQGLELWCTASIGVSLFYGHETSVDELLKHSDFAMYHAKNEGRNGIRFFDPEMQATLVERSALESDLRHALGRGQLRLYYQIQVNNERHAIGAEALLRWVHPERGLIFPEQFIPLAEKIGLIVPIGVWVLQTACAQIRDWSTNPATRDLQLALNASALELRQPNFVEQVRQAISITGINPALLKIELTESLLVDNVSDTVAKMNALKALGISFSMDDFGTAYSSLAYLKQLPLDQLKIDQSFIRDLGDNPSNAALVQAIILMGRTFGLDVIAEGVEAEAQMEFLNLNGCDAYQGYLFSRPLPLKEFEAFVKQVDTPKVTTTLNPGRVQHSYAQPS